MLLRLVQLGVLGAVVLGATVLMALPKRGPVGTGTDVSRDDTGDRGGREPAPVSPVPAAPVPTAPVTTTPVPAAPVTTAPVTTTPVTTAPAGTGSVTTAPVVTTPDTGSGTRVHAVVSGETLQKISKLYYGSYSKWRVIADANPGVDPTRLRPGMKLRVP